MESAVVSEMVALMGNVAVGCLGAEGERQSVAKTAT